MAKLVPNYEPRKKGPPSKYPWDQWLDGQQWLITQGQDFECSLDTMERYIRKTAAENPTITHMHISRKSTTELVIKAEKELPCSPVTAAKKPPSPKRKPSSR